MSHLHITSAIAYYITLDTIELVFPFEIQNCKPGHIAKIFTHPPHKPSIERITEILYIEHDTILVKNWGGEIDDTFETIVLYETYETYEK
jgi:hypothetical protein